MFGFHTVEVTVGRDRFFSSLLYSKFLDGEIAYNHQETSKYYG